MEQNTAVVSALLDDVKREWAELDDSVKEHRLEEHMAGIGECVIGDSSTVIGCLGLGSCVGVVIFDTNAKLAGLAHVMLPSKSMALSDADSSALGRKFADVAIPYLVASLSKMGCSTGSMRAKLTGGAQMFRTSSDELFDIGKRNVDSVKEQLSLYHIPIVSEDTYGTEGRTMKFIVGTSKLFVRTKSNIKLL